MYVYVYIYVYMYIAHAYTRELTRCMAFHPLLVLVNQLEKKVAITLYNNNQ